MLNHLLFYRSHAKSLSQNKIQKGQFAWSRGMHYCKQSIGHQRLHARNLNFARFARWLVGFTDGDGCFCIVSSNEKFNVSFSISQSVYNIRVLAHIKKHLGVGSISSSKSMAVFRIRNAKHLDQIVFPIFDTFPLQTFKCFHAKRAKLATAVMLNQELSTSEKRDCLLLLKNLTAPEDSEWSRIVQCKQSSGINLNDDWILGFMESEASFFILKKSKTRFVSAFGITQKRDKRVLDAIRSRFSIAAKVRWNSSAGAYSLETTNQAALLRIYEFARGQFKGMKSLELKLWSRALYYQSSKETTCDTPASRVFAPQTKKSERVFQKLEQIQSILRRLKSRESGGRRFADSGESDV